MNTKRKEVVEAVPERTRDVTLMNEMDRLFDTFMSRGWFRPFHELMPEWGMSQEGFEIRSPRADVVDLEEEVVVRAELPGVDKDHVEISLTGETLTFKGERREEKKEEKEGDVYRSEIAQGTFSRTMRLPAAVDPEGAKAEFKDGVLEIHLPKLHKVERHSISVE